MKPPARLPQPLRLDSSSRSGSPGQVLLGGPSSGSADLLVQLALWLADVSAEAALEPDAQPEDQGEVVALQRTAVRRQR